MYEHSFSECRRYFCGGYLDLNQCGHSFVCMFLIRGLFGIILNNRSRSLLLLLKKPRLDLWYRQRCSFINISTVPSSSSAVPTVSSSTIAFTSRTESASIGLPSTSFSYVCLCTGLAPFWARILLCVVSS